jgi:large conductance mechanosensitive channel
MIKEFKEFAVKGNVIDLAVGVVIGGAFGSIVTSLVKDVVMPPIGLLLGKVDFSQQFLVLKEGKIPGPYPTIEYAHNVGAVTLNYGAFLNAIFSFLILAFVVFLLVKAINKLKRDQPPAPETPAETKEVLLLTEIRDALRAEKE